MRSEEDVKRERAQAEAEQDALEAAFQAVFTSPGSDKVLAYLYKTCSAGVTTFDPNPFAAAHNEGRRLVYLGILKYSDVEEGRVRRLIRDERAKRALKQGN